MPSALKNKITSIGSFVLIVALISGWFLIKERAEAALLQSNSSNWTTTGTNPKTVTLGSNVAVGDLVVAWVTYSDSLDTNVTFSNTGTATVDSWTEVAALDYHNGTNTYGQEVAYARVTGAGTLTVRGTLAISRDGAIMVATFNQMPDVIELQDSQIDLVNLGGDLSGTDMTPTSQPALVVGMIATWGNYSATLVDTAAGFVDIDTGMNVVGSGEWVRMVYQQITSTADLDIEFLQGDSDDPYFVGGLIFTESSPTPSPAAAEIRGGLNVRGGVNFR